MRKATFHIQNVFTTVDADERAYRLLDEEFKYFVPNAQHMPKVKAKKWDGFKHLFSPTKHTFPTGLLSDAIALLDGYSITIDDQRQRPDHPLKPWNLKGAEEREHQTEAITAALEDERGIIYHATGAGKTEVMAGITQMLDLPTIVMVHQKSIAEQTAKRLKERLGVKVGLYSSGKKIDAKITVATFQTLQSRLKEDRAERTWVLRNWLRQFKVLHIDEAHHALAATYQNVINECDAYYRYGFSATPFKTKEDRVAYLHLVGSTGPVLDRFKAGEGVEKNLLVPADITMVQWHPDQPKDYWKPWDFEINDKKYTYSGKKTKLVEYPDGKKKRVPLPKKEWQPGLYSVGISENNERNEAVIDAACLLIEDGLKTLILVERIDHGKLLRSLIETEVGMPVGFIHGNTNSEDRVKAMRLLAEGEICALVSSTILDEGVDVPAIDGLVFASGGKAQHRYIQRLGRGQRTSPGKTSLTVIDFWDTHSRILWNHAKERLEAYNSDPIAYRVEIEDITS